MPIQPMSFNKITFQDANPFLSGLVAAQKYTQTAQMFPEDLRKAQLANALAQIQNKYAEPMAQSELALKKAQLPYMEAQTGLMNKDIQWYDPKIQAAITSQQAQAGLASSEAAKNRYVLEHPGFMGGQEAKTIEALKAMGILDLSKNQQPQQGQQGQQPQQNQGADQTQPFKTGNPMVDAILNKGFARSSYDQKMTQAFDYVHAPPDAKNYALAQLAGAGIDPSVGMSELTSGKTVPQILQENGFDPNNPPDPDFLPTRGNIQQLKNRQSALKEIEYLGSFIREGLGDYSQTINGMSPAQVKDALMGMNDDKQARFLAARALVPEQSNLRLKLAGANVGVTAQEELSQKSMGNINIYQSLVTPKVFDKAQRLIDEKLSSAFSKAQEAYTKVGRNKGTSTSSEYQGEETQASSQESKTINGQSYVKINGQWYHQ